MTKKEFKPFEWMVLYHNINSDKIEQYNILKYREDDIKKMRKESENKKGFSEKLKRELMYYYWSKCEWEMIISKTEDNRIVLTPWCGCRNPDEVAIDVTDDNNFNWIGFADYILERKGRDNKAKIDVWDQIEFKYDVFLDYVWNYRFKYERKKNRRIIL